jgi:hypothetical protein
MTKEIYRPTEADLVEGWGWDSNEFRAIKCKLLCDRTASHKNTYRYVVLNDDGLIDARRNFSTENPNTPKTRPMTMEEIHEKYAQGALFNDAKEFAFGITPVALCFHDKTVKICDKWVEIKDLWYKLPGQEPKKAEVEE